MENNIKLGIVESKMGSMPTVKVTNQDRSFFLYSKYDPGRDAKAFASGIYDKGIRKYLIYGLGLGYHISALEDMLREDGLDYHIYVLETNQAMYELARTNMDLDRIINNENISFHFIGESSQNIGDINKIFELNNLKIANHKPSLNIIPDEYRNFKYLLEEYEAKISSIERHIGGMDANFEENIKNYDDNVDVLFKKHINKPLYLIAAGPSLDKNIHHLSQVKDKGVILAVGRAVRPLIKAKIRPDYIIITDRLNHIYKKQLEDLELNIPIIVLSTADKNAFLTHKGHKYIGLQEGYEPAENYAKENKNDLVSTGGSVATTALDIGIKMGCNPIIFVGQDLAFINNQSHAKDTFSKNIIELDSYRDVEDIYGNEIKTSLNLYSYLRWIENRISSEKKIEFIDATEGGARIKGTKIMKLSDIIEIN